MKYLKLLLVLILSNLTLCLWAQSKAVNYCEDIAVTDDLDCAVVQYQLENGETEEEIVCDSFFVITGDGNFIRRVAALTANHCYSQTGTYYPYIIRTDAYSDEDDDMPAVYPDTIQVGSKKTGPENETRRKVEVVEQCYTGVEFDREVLMWGDTTVIVVSIKNTDAVTSISGNLYLFYNGLLWEEDMATGTTLPLQKRGESEQARFEMSIDTQLVYTNKIAEGVGYNYTGDLSSIIGDYNKVMVWPYQNLAPNQEEHIFLLASDTSKLNSGNLAYSNHANYAYTNFFTAATVTNGSDVAPCVNEEESLTQQQQNLLTEVLNSIGGQTRTVDRPKQNNQIIGWSRLGARVADYHDPNGMIIQACECPSESQAKVQCTVNYENDGTAAALNAQIELPLNRKLFNTASITDVQFLPAATIGGNANVEWEIDGDTIRFDMSGFLLSPLRNLSGTNRVKNNSLSFIVELQPEISIADLTDLSACIAIGRYGRVECTPPTVIESVNDTDELFKKLSCRPTSECRGSNGWIPFAIAVVGVGAIGYFFRKRK